MSRACELLLDNRGLVYKLKDSPRPRVSYLLILDSICFLIHFLIEESYLIGWMIFASEVVVHLSSSHFPHATFNGRENGKLE